MFINTLTQQVVTLPWLRSLFPAVSFPASGPDSAWLLEKKYAAFTDNAAPAAPDGKVYFKDGVELAGTWQWKWSLRDMTSQELEDLHAGIVTALSEYRWQKEIGGITVAGINVRTDDRSKLLINGMFNLAMMGAPDSERDFLAPSGKVTITNAQAIAIAAAVGDHVQNCITAYGTVVENIGNYLNITDACVALDVAYDALVSNGVESLYKIS